MTYMLARNRVEDFERWHAVFASHRASHVSAGLTLESVWRVKGDPNTVFFLFEVADVARAEAFISDPSSAEAGKEAGVLEGEYHYVENAPGY